MLPAWTEAIEHGEAKHREQQQRGPTQIDEHAIAHSGQADNIERQRQHDDGRYAQQHAANSPDREQKRHDIESYKAARFIRIMDDVECIENRLHASVGAPQRKAETEEKSEGQLAVALCGDAGDFVADDVERTRGNNTNKKRKMIADRVRIGK